MRRIAIGSMAVAAVIFAAGVSAQGKPSFSGKWTRDDAGMVTAGGGAPAGGGGGGGQRGGGQRGAGVGGGAGFNCAMTCTITQDGNTLKVDRAQGDQTFTSIFKLDGTESKNQVAGQGGMTDVVTIAKWDGNKITFTTKREINMGGNAMSITAIQTISMDGGNLVVEGSTDRGQGPQVTPKATYKKS